MNQPNFQQTQTSQSFKQINTQANDLIAKAEYGKLKELISKEVKLVESLTHFKEIWRDPQKQSNNQKIDKFQAKWALGAEISQSMKNQIIYLLTEQLNIDLEGLIELCNQYFQLNEAVYHQIVQSEKRISDMQVDYELKVKTQQYQQNFAQAERLKIDSWNNNLNNYCQKVVCEVRMAYFAERKCLVDFVMSLISSNKEHVQSIGRELLQKPSAVLNIIKSLTRNLEWREEFAQLPPEEKNEKLTLNIYDEQISLIQSLFAYWSTNAAKEEEQKAYLEFMNLTKFQGQMRKAQAHGEFASESLKRSDLKILSQLTSIAMLGLGLQKPQYKGQMTVEENQITQASSFLFLPMAVLSGQIDKYGNRFDQLPLIEEFKEVMSWTLRSNFYSKSQAVGLLNHWLNYLFDFDQTQKKGQARNNNLVQQIQQIGMNLLNDKYAIANVWKEGIEKLRIYSDIFNKPNENFESLLAILCKLCGSQQQPHADKVMEFIKQKNLWPDIYRWLTVKLQHLFEQKLDEREIICLLFAITLIAKIIKQQPERFEELNEIYVETAKDWASEKSKQRNDPSNSALRRPNFSASRDSIRQDSGTQFEDGDLGLVSFLVKSLHTFFMLEQSYGDKPICNLLDALTKIYKLYKVTQEPMMKLICRFTLQRQSRTPQLIEHMTDFNAFKTQQLISFFRFIKTAFKQEDPFSSLEENDIYVPERNFLCTALSQVYSPIVQNYLNIPFQKEKERSSFMNELFRLTQVLLSKFNQIKDDGQKVLITQQTPYFDFLLQVLSQVLNPPQVNQMCLQAIYIVQSRLFGNETGFLNKIQNDLGGDNQSRHFVWMITSAIQVLNKMLELAKSTSIMTGQRESISLQSAYIVNMLSIQDLHKCVNDQTTLRMEDQTLITIPALLTYYIFPAGSLVQHDFIRIEALKFLTSTLQIQTNTNTLATLKATFGQNLSQQLSFFNFIKHERYASLSVAYLDFWIQAVQTHGNLAEELLQAKDSKLLVETLQEPFQQTYMHIKNALKHKICILLSLMSINRCCTKVLDFNSQSVAQKVYECVIAPLLEQVAGVNVDLNGQVLMYAQNIDATVVEIAASLNAKIAIFYFIKLIQSEFDREPSSKTIRSLIEKLYANRAFQTIAIDQNLDEQYQELFDIVHNVNENFLRDSESRPAYNLVRMQAISRTPEFVKRFDDGQSSLLFSQDGSVYLSNIQGKDQLAKFETTALHDYYNSAFYVSESNGMLGAQFVIDVTDLKLRLRQAGYDPEKSLQVCCIFQEFNLALSTIAVNNLLLKAKAEFILNVGQTQMQVVIRNQVSQDLILTSSLLPLVSGEELYPKTKEQVQRQRFQLVDWSINSIKTLHQVIEKSKQKVQNAFLAQNLEGQIKMLLVYLGIVGHLVAALGDDHNQLSREIPSVMNSLLAALPINGLFKNDDKETHVLFCQLVTLILQIQVTLGQKCQSPTILQSLGHVITGMQRGHCLTDGIQIFILICDMIDTDSFVHLMNRQTQGSPLQLIISRIGDPKISSEEMQLILTLLQSFARSEEGSENIHKHKVLNHLINSESFKLLDVQSPYITTSQEQNRNHIHTWWLQVLVLIRQMNANLIRNPRTTDSAYFKDLNKIVKSLQYRFQSVLQVNLMQVAPSARSPASAISIAILEETELVCQILSQMFQHADFWFELDKKTYSEMKDLVLFAVPKVFINCVEMRTLNPTSVTERHLQGINEGNLNQNQEINLGSQNQRTALQLKMEMSLIKSIMACTASLHNIVTLQKQSQQNQMIQTWGRIDNTNQASFEQTYLNQQVREPFMQFAFENLLKAMQYLRGLYLNYGEPQNQVKKLVQTLSKVFLTDQWVQSEYKGGLASILIEESFEELIENIEVTLAMGVYVLGGLLEQISSNLSGDIGFTGGSAQKYQPGGYGSGMYDTDYGHGKIEERHLVLMAKNLAQTVRQLNETVKPDNQPWADDNYLKAILDYTESLTNNPTGTMHYY